MPCDHDHHNAAAEKAVALYENISGLSEEHQIMLALKAISAAHQTLADALAGDGSDAQSAVVLAGSTLALAGASIASLQEKHENWTSTGDKAVNKVWEQWGDVIKTATSNSEEDYVEVKEGDLPEEVTARVASGEATADDYDLLRRLVADKSGRDIDDIEIDIRTPDGEPIKAPSANLDSTGHEYGGQYL